MQIHSTAGTFIDLAAGQHYIRAKMCCQTDYTTAVQAQILHGSIGTAFQIQNAAAAFSPFPGMSCGEAFKGNIGTVLDSDHICPSGFCFDDGGQAAIASDGEVFYAADHEFMAIVAAFPGTVIIIGILTVGFCLTEIISTGFQDDLPIRTDGCDEFIHILDGHRLHSVSSNDCFTSLFSRRSHQTDGNENNSDDTCKADPEAGLLVVQHGFNPVLDRNFTEGHRTGCKMCLIGGAVQQGCRIGLSLLQLHELNHTLITGHFDILTKQDISNPDERIEPMQSQGDEADHLEPVVTLFQMSALMSQDIFPDHRRQAHGDIDLGTDKAQDKGCFDSVTFPSAFDFDCFPDLQAKLEIGIEGIDQEKRRYSQPDPRNQRHPVDHRSCFLRNHGFLDNRCGFNRCYIKYRGCCFCFLSVFLLDRNHWCFRCIVQNLELCHLLKHWLRARLQT